MESACEKGFCGEWRKINFLMICIDGVYSFSILCSDIEIVLGGLLVGLCIKVWGVH